MLLQFNQDGLLPPGDYPMTITQLKESLLVIGPGITIEPNWDSEWRLHLVEQLEILANQLWLVKKQHPQSHIGEIYIDGSFSEQKAHPGDIDGYFECDMMFLANGLLQRALNGIDPHKVWTWDPFSRRACPGSTKKQLPMWHRYNVELYPHYPDLLSGIRDEYGNNQQFPAAFRKTRDTFKPKGIIQLIED